MLDHSVCAFGFVMSLHKLSPVIAVIRLVKDD